MIRGNDHGWTSDTVLPPIVIGALLVAAFIAWDLRARQPMLPMHLFRSRAFTATNLASLLMFFGMFGSIFLLAQSCRSSSITARAGRSADPALDRHAGAHRPHRGCPVRPHRRARRCWSPAWPCRPSDWAGWPRVVSPTVAYITMVPAFVIAGVGMSLFFAPVANVVLSSVRRDQEGIASGASNAIRELGGVFGIAVLGAVSGPRQLCQRYGVRLRPGPGRLGRRGRGGRRVGRRPVPAADAQGRRGRIRGRAGP